MKGEQQDMGWHGHPGLNDPKKPVRGVMTSMAGPLMQRDFYPGGRGGAAPGGSPAATGPAPVVNRDVGAWQRPGVPGGGGVAGRMAAGVQPGSEPIVASYNPGNIPAEVLDALFSQGGVGTELPPEGGMGAGGAVLPPSTSMGAGGQNLPGAGTNFGASISSPGVESWFNAPDGEGITDTYTNVTTPWEHGSGSEADAIGRSQGLGDVMFEILMRQQALSPDVTARTPRVSFR